MNKRTQAEQVFSSATHRRATEPRAADGGCLRAAGHALPTFGGSAVARFFYNLKG